LHLKPNPGEEETSAMIKYLFLLVLFGVVFCEPEPEGAPEPKGDPSADPWYYYGGYPYYGGHYGFGHGYYGYGHGYYGHLWGRKKRAAEPVAAPASNAEPNADPYYYYGHYGYPYYSGHYYGGYPYYRYWG